MRDRIKRIVCISELHALANCMPVRLMMGGMLLFIQRLQHTPTHA